jgi:hypothetical protein
MELALYGPGGFYRTPPVGAGGDFVTSPHVHPVFCQLLTEAIRELGDHLGRRTLRLAEVGPGDGTLARCVLDGAGELPIAYTAVERSPGARTALSAIEGIEVRTEIPPAADVVFANELLDNLPVRILRGEREVRIGLEGEHLVEVLVPAESELLASTDTGRDRIAPVGALAFIDRLRRTIERGYALLIDYGGLGTTGGPVHGYRGHGVVEDVLANPGRTDITTGVDFELIASYAGSLGLTAFPTVTQRSASGARLSMAARPARTAAPVDGRRRGNRSGPDMVGPQPSEPADRSRWPRTAPVDAPRDAGARSPTVAGPRFRNDRPRRSRLIAVHLRRGAAGRTVPRTSPRRRLSMQRRRLSLVMIVSSVVAVVLVGALTVGGGTAAAPSGRATTERDAPGEGAKGGSSEAVEEGQLTQERLDAWRTAKAAGTSA